MYKRSLCGERLEGLVVAILSSLDKDELFQIRVPSVTSAGDIQDLIESEDMAGGPGLGEARPPRRIDSAESSRNYSQLLALAAIVAELAASIKTLKII
jgi:hypothetical protein